MLSASLVTWCVLPVPPASLIRKPSVKLKTHMKELVPTRPLSLFSNPNADLRLQRIFFNISVLDVQKVEKEKHQEPWSNKNVKEVKGRTTESSPYVNEAKV